MGLKISRGRLVLEGEAWNPFHGYAELHHHAERRRYLENRNVPQADGQAPARRRCRVEKSAQRCQYAADVGAPAEKISLDQTEEWSVEFFYLPLTILHLAFK
jgi:hypothetical protein